LKSGDVGFVNWDVSTLGENSPQTVIFKVFLMPFLCCFLIAGLCVGLCSAATDKNEVVPEEGPDVAVIDASVKMDISDMGDIPLGTIPDERLIVTIT
jgi:hypothetical protein